MVSFSVGTKDARTLSFQKIANTFEERALEMKSVTVQGVSQDDTPYFTPSPLYTRMIVSCPDVG
jgi:hypothetical protein